MKTRTYVAVLLIILALALVLSGNKVWAASIIFLWMLLYLLAKYRPFAIQDIPLDELNERYAIPYQRELYRTQSQLRYRSRYINLGHNLQETETEPWSVSDAVRYPMVHYCDNMGNGPVIVALHGIMDSSHGWEGWISEIGEHYRIVAVDLPGFGLTGPLLSGDYSMRTYVQFIADFVEALGLRHFHLVGNSLGGGVAWNYAIRNDSKIDKLVLIDPVGFPQQVPEIVWFVSLPIIDRIIPFFTPRLIFSRYVKQVYGDPTKASGDIVNRFFEIALRPGSRSAVVRIFKLMVAQAKDENLGARIAEIERSGLGKRTLLMWGSKDRWIPPEHVDLWLEKVPSLSQERCRRYQELGHIPHEEDPKRTAKDVDDFLRAATCSTSEMAPATDAFSRPISHLQRNGQSGIDGNTPVRVCSQSRLRQHEDEVMID